MQREDKLPECIADLKGYCDQLGWSFKDVVGKRRTKDITKQRHYLMWILRMSGFSFPIIGKAFNRDHSTVISAVKKGFHEDLPVSEKKHQSAA
jgi:chromosomal replication initiation ATPase DnaA